MSTLCFVCKLPILSHQISSDWIDQTTVHEGLTNEGQALGITVQNADDVYRGNTYHDDCLVCVTCGARLAGSRLTTARRYQNKIYCSLHYADVTGLSSGEEFMQKLREFKCHSLGCAEARRKSSTTLQFPMPVQACPGSSCDRYSHFIKPTPGYWIECSGSTTDAPDTDGEASNCNSISEGVSMIVHSNSFPETESNLELSSFEDEAYGKYYYSTEHWNYFTNDELLGPVLLSIKQENVSNRDQFRILIRTVSYSLHGLVPSSCICANRYDREAVVRELSNEAGLKPAVVLGQLPSTPDELLKLDQVFVKSELKVGVVYVKEGQSAEEQILGNTQHSFIFDEFLSVLGERISLKGFDKYKGGLDTVHDLTGRESIYTCWRGIEIMFHVSTLLPNEEHDTQKLQRKRHIGNDIVCVAFLESDSTNFSPACIKSHFLHTFIVVRSSPTRKSNPTVYEVSVVSRDEVSAFKPYLWHRSTFVKEPYFREWLLTKVVNGERASYAAPKFARMQDRTKSQLLDDIVTNLQNHLDTGQIPKPYRRGSWRPIGHMRPSSPLLDSLRDTFEGYEQLAKDFMRAFSTPHLCDIVFHVGQGKKKSKIYAVRAILGVRSRVFLEMLYGFATGFGPTSGPTIDHIEKQLNPARKTSNFLQVPDMHEPHNRSAPASPMVFRAISRLGSWTGWGMGSRRNSNDLFAGDNRSSMKRWQTEENDRIQTRSTTSASKRYRPLVLQHNAEIQQRVLLFLLYLGVVFKKDQQSETSTSRDKSEKEKQQQQQQQQQLQLPADPAATITLSVCADVQKIDRAKLSQTEFNIIEFDTDTFQLLIEYLHGGSCPLSLETVPGLICAAEHFDLPELLQACFHHAKQYLHINKVCPMLVVLENYYWRYTSATELVNMILQYIDVHARKLFERKDVFKLSESMFQMIIGRELNISELHKFHTMLEWTNHKIRMVGKPDSRDLYCTMNRLTRDLKLYKIPPQDLIKVVLPTKTISNERILETLLYQADTGMYRIHASYLDQCRNSPDVESVDQWNAEL